MCWRVSTSFSLQLTGEGGEPVDRVQQAEDLVPQKLVREAGGDA